MPHRCSPHLRGEFVFLPLNETRLLLVEHCSTIIMCSNNTIKYKYFILYKENNSIKKLIYIFKGKKEKDIVYKY